MWPENPTKEDLQQMVYAMPEKFTKEEIIAMFNEATPLSVKDLDVVEVGGKDRPPTVDERMTAIEERMDRLAKDNQTVYNSEERRKKAFSDLSKTMEQDIQGIKDWQRRQEADMLEQVEQAIMQTDIGQQVLGEMSKLRMKVELHMEQMVHDTMKKFDDALVQIEDIYEILDDLD